MKTLLSIILLLAVLGNVPAFAWGHGGGHSHGSHHNGHGQHHVKH